MFSILGEKSLTFEEFLPIYSQLRKEVKDQGCYEDFVECLKLYDKDENGKMLVGELSHSLLALGKWICLQSTISPKIFHSAEKLTDAEVDELFDDCLDEEDDDGQIDYDRK